MPLSILKMHLSTALTPILQASTKRAGKRMQFRCFPFHGQQCYPPDKPAVLTLRAKPGTFIHPHNRHGSLIFQHPFVLLTIRLILRPRPEP